jgi:putative peptidoglycan lipid II flippase
VNKALLVAAGILVSRLSGFVRLRAFAHYFGLQSDAADAFNAGFRICNVLQNLFGEGALSASFIPAYASLVARGDRRTADRLAGSVAALLSLLVAALVLVGVIAAPLLASVLAPGFTGEKRTLTIAIVRVLFPGAGLLVLSAWCLGVLNSHQRFLLSYAAPVLWNAAMIATLVAFGADTEPPRLAILLAWGSVAGSALQAAVQLVGVLRVAPGIRLVLGAASEQLRSVVRNFLPALVSRGIVQISAFVDVLIATLLPTGAVTGLANAQLIHSLPVSLFGTSVAAAELPAMSGEASPDRAGAEALRARLNSGLRRVGFFVVPSAVAFLALGDVVAAAILQTGRFVASDSLYVWGILAGSAVGLLASTLGRLYSSAYYALRDTDRPLRYAVVRVVLTVLLGLVSALSLPAWLGLEPKWGAAGLTVSSGLAAWVEMLLLRAGLSARVGPTGLGVQYGARLWGAAISAAAVAWIVRLALPALPPILTAVPVLGSYGSAFLLLTAVLGIPEASASLARLRGRSPAGSTRSE